jgi:hypothetical protein
MDTLVCEAARLIESAQTGQADEVRRTVEARLIGLSGSIEAVLPRCTLPGSSPSGRPVTTARPLPRLT